jgi:hypothetical protein
MELGTAIDSVQTHRALTVDGIRALSRDDASGDIGSDWSALLFNLMKLFAF